MEIQWLEVLKWVGIALAAGFIGYFGRYFAMMLIDRMQGKKPVSADTTKPEEPPVSPEVALEETRLKIEKKRAKAEAKRLKKAGKK